MSGQIRKDKNKVNKMANDVINFLMKKLNVKENELFRIDGKGQHFFRNGYLYHGDPKGDATQSAKLLSKLVLGDYESIDKISEKPKHEFKVGDRVRIRQWDDMIREFGTYDFTDINCKGFFVSGMKDLCGHEAIIEGIDSNSFVELKYLDEEPGWKWVISTDMLEPVTQENQIDEINNSSDSALMLIQMIEESGELVQACTKLYRFLSEDISLLEMSQSDAMDNLFEEMADVEVCLSRLKRAFHIEDLIRARVRFKISRTLCRLGKEKDHENF